MKKIFLWFALFPLFAFAADNAQVNCAVNNLGPTYNITYPQLTLTGLVNKSHLAILNNTGNTICCNSVNPSPLNPPPSGGGNERCTPAGAYAALDFVTINANVYCRTQSGTTSSGTFAVWTW